MNPTQSLNEPQALALFAEYANARRWIVRRVETVECHDDSSTRRRTSIDFVIRESAQLLEDGFLIPIAILAKEPHSNLDLRDESNRPVSLLTADQAKSISTYTLLEALGQIPGLEPEDVDRLSPMVLSVCHSSSTEIDARTELFNELHGILRSRAGQRPDGGRGLEQSRERHYFEQIAEVFDRGFLLVAYLQGRVGNRRILKLAYDDVFHFPPATKKVERVRRFLGWEGVPFDFNIPDVGASASYHFECISPPDVEITQGLLVNVQTYEKVDNSQPSILPRLVIGGSPRIHLNTNRAASSDGAFARVVFRPARGPWLRNALGTVTMVSITLILSSIMLTKWLVERVGLLPREIAPTDAIVSLLVVLPGLVAAIVTRPAAHAVAARLLGGVRFVVLTSGGFALVAAWAYVALKQDTSWVWNDMAIAAVLASAIVWASYTYPTTRERTTDALHRRLTLKR